MREYLTIALMASRDDPKEAWEVHWAVLDEMHSDPQESGTIVAPHHVPALHALRMALSRAWKAAQHLHV